MLTKQEILNTLPNFYGTEAYYRYSPQFRNFLLTDGAVENERVICFMTR